MWKAVPGLPNVAVTRDGQVKNLLTGNVLKWDVSGTTAYPRVTVTTVKPYRRYSVHQLVALAYLGPRPRGLEHNHKDGNKLNPHADNLEYVTKSQNELHSYSHLGKQPRRGSAHGRSIIDETTAQAIWQARAGGERLEPIARRFNVSVSTVSMIGRGKIWRHAGISDLGKFRATV